MKPETGMLRGFRFSAVAAGIKTPGAPKLDFGLIVADAPAVAAGVTTTNVVYAAPVAITRERLSNGWCQAVLANSGNANAYTGKQGKLDAAELTDQVARVLGIDHTLVIPMSTGVIGNPLPIERISPHIPDLVRGLRPDGYMDFASAIMTTDTRPKVVVRDGEVSTGPVKMMGIAKGSGMIAPNMATLLAVVLIDMKVDSSFLRDCLAHAVQHSLNRITVDGDLSTNDTLVALAGGRADAAELGDTSRDRETFGRILDQVCLDLAKALVADGEGATKVVEIRVTGAPDNGGAARVARTIAESLLVKTALYGQDPNWGRIVAAAGRAGVPFDPDKLDLAIGDVPVVGNGALVSGDWESLAKEVMKQREFSISVDLKCGTGQAAFLTTDLSEEYVRINADYRT